MIVALRPFQLILKGKISRTDDWLRTHFCGTTNLGVHSLKLPDILSENSSKIPKVEDLVSFFRRIIEIPIHSGIKHCTCTAILGGFHLIADSALFGLVRPKSQEILFPLLHFCRQHLETEVAARVSSGYWWCKTNWQGMEFSQETIDPKVVEHPIWSSRNLLIFVRAKTNLEVQTCMENPRKIFLGLILLGFHCQDSVSTNFNSPSLNQFISLALLVQTHLPFWTAHFPKVNVFV